jgi:glycosyltransferase involved in cell wall biosynthesis
VGGLEDIVVDAASGILVPRGDVEGMADACEIIFSNRERTNYNKRVSPDVHRYDAKIQTAAYLKLYEQLLSVSN